MEQGVGLETSRPPFQPHLFYNSNLNFINVRLPIFLLEKLKALSLQDSTHTGKVQFHSRLLYPAQIKNNHIVGNAAYFCHCCC